MSTTRTIFRLLVVILTCALSFGLAGMLMAGSMATGFGWPYSSSFGSGLAIFSMTVGLVAWALLLVMGIAWSFNKRVHKSIPITGTVIGCLSLLAWLKSWAALIVLAPAVLLAIQLVEFHLRGERPPRSKWFTPAQ